MSKFKDLIKKHEKEIKQLQKNCKHKKITDWLSEYWAPGHLTMRQVKICKECNKIVETKELLPMTGAITTASGNLSIANTQND